MEEFKTATFAGGCFWCTEAVFQRLKGVKRVVSGYSGGDTANPSYDQVSSESTGHAEAIQITFDPQVITFIDLLRVFFATHDPTTVDRQGADVGSQYRSVIFYHDEAQKNKVENYIQELTEKGAYDSPIVTQLKPYTKFYDAEKYHKNYYDKNSDAPYCRIVIDPKIQKLYKEFGDRVK